MFLSGFFQELDPTSLTSVLVWVIAGPGVVWLVGKFMAIVLELFPAWANLPTYVKTVVPMVLAALLGVAAQLLIAQPALVAAIEPWFKVIMLAVLAWVASQVQYMAGKRAEFGARFRE